MASPLTTPSGNAALVVGFVTFLVMKFWNYFTVLFHTRNHAWNWNKITWSHWKSSETISKLFQRQWKRWENIPELQRASEMILK